MAWSASPVLVVGVLTCQVLSSIVPAALAWIGRGIINAIADAAKMGMSDLGGLTPWLIAGCFATLLAETVELLRQMAQRTLDERLRFHISMLHLEQAARLDLSFFEDSDFQDVVSRASTNTAAHVTGFFSKLAGLLTGNLKALGLVSVLYYIDPLIPFLALLLVLPYMWFRWVQSRARYNCEYSRATKRRWTNYFVSMLTDRKSMPEVKIFRLAPMLIKKYSELAHEFIQQDRKIYSREYWGQYIFYVLFGFFFYLLFIRVANGVIQSRLTIGDVTMFAGATRILFSLMGTISAQLTQVLEESMFVSDVTTYLEAKPKIVSGEKESPHQPRGEIEFQDITFSYAGSRTNVLAAFNLHVQPGEVIALVGANGAGKSTLLKLLMRLYDPDSGSICIDGINIKDFSEDSLHRQVAYLGQEGNRYEDSVINNIAFGNWTAENRYELAREAAKLSGVDQLIESMPQGEDTLLGRKFGDYDLSGGQWHKIALARMIANRNASVLVFDEPLAGLDAVSVDKFCNKFREIVGTRSAILVSHRQEALRLVDRIVVLSEGQCVETGTFDELMTLGTVFSSLFKLHEQY